MGCILSRLSIYWNRNSLHFGNVCFCRDKINWSISMKFMKNSLALESVVRTKTSYDETHSMDSILITQSIMLMDIVIDCNGDLLMLKPMMIWGFATSKQTINLMKNDMADGERMWKSGVEVRNVKLVAKSENFHLSKFADNLTSPWNTSST